MSTFTRTDATPTAMATPISVGCVWGLSYDAGNNGKLWVVSKSGSKVYRFASPTGSIDLAGVSLTDAYGIAVDGSGNAWVSSCSGNSVQQISAAGVVGSPIALTDFPCPGGLALDKQGTLWVLSAGAGNGTSGNLVSLNGSTAQPPAQLADAGDCSAGSPSIQARPPCPCTSSPRATRNPCRASLSVEPTGCLPSGAARRTSSAPCLAEPSFRRP